MIRTLTALMAILLSLATMAATAEEESGWELARDRDGIQVYTRRVEGSKFKAVRATMVIDATARSAVALIMDTTQCQRWAALCKESYAHEVVSDNEAYIYTYNDVPWPVKDRDALTHVIWSVDENTGVVSMKATATTGRLPETKAVRITYAKTSWVFTPTEDGRLDIVSEAHVDPSGPTPAWLTNLLLVDSPFDTLKNLRELLATGEFDDVPVAFLP